MQELQDTLEKALEFLLSPESTKHDLASQSLNEIFYAHITGIDRHTAIEIWGLGLKLASCKRSLSYQAPNMCLAQVKTSALQYPGSQWQMILSI